MTVELQPLGNVCAAQQRFTAPSGLEGEGVQPSTQTAEGFSSGKSKLNSAALGSTHLKGV